MGFNPFPTSHVDVPLQVLLNGVNLLIALHEFNPAVFVVNFLPLHG